MSALPQIPEWTARRWMLTIGFVFLTQIALALMLGERAGATARTVEKKTNYRMAVQPPELAPSLMLDPTLFVLAHPHGFSGEAWLKRLPPRHEPAEWTEPPRWLDLKPGELGRTFGGFVRTHSLPPFTTAEQLPPPLGPVLVLAPENLDLKSVVRVEGDLRVDSPLPLDLPVWHHSEPLPKSTVQVLVDRSGGVLSARLLARSGLPEADRHALAVTGQMRFAPALGEEGIDSGRLIFHWHTTPAVTNSANGSP